MSLPAIKILLSVAYSQYSLPMATKLVCLLISTYLLLAGDYHVVSGFTPVIYSSESSSTECGQSDPLQDDQLMECTQQDPSGARSSRMQPSSKQILSRDSLLLPISSLRLPNEIRVPNGSLVQVYCDMEGTNCGGQGGWMRVAHVNMSTLSLVTGNFIVCPSYRMLHSTNRLEIDGWSILKRLVECSVRYYAQTMKLPVTSDKSCL